MTNREVELHVDGTRLALMLSAAFMLDNWPFERPAAKAMVRSVSRELVEETSELMLAESNRILQASGALHSPTSIWTREFITQRAASAGCLRLTHAQAQTLILALRACHAEFVDNWEDFCTASPGAIELYPTDAAELLHVARELEDILATQ